VRSDRQVVKGDRVRGRGGAAADTPTPTQLCVPNLACNHRAVGPAAARRVHALRELRTRQSKPAAKYQVSVQSAVRTRTIQSARSRLISQTGRQFRGKPGQGTRPWVTKSRRGRCSGRTNAQAKVTGPSRRHWSVGSARPGRCRRLDGFGSGMPGPTACCRREGQALRLDGRPRRGGKTNKQGGPTISGMSCSPVPGVQASRSPLNGASPTPRAAEADEGDGRGTAATADQHQSSRAAAA